MKNKKYHTLDTFSKFNRDIVKTSQHKYMITNVHGFVQALQ